MPIYIIRSSSRFEVTMKKTLGLLSLAAVLVAATASAQTSTKIQHVLLISIDGMHAVDY